MSEDLSYPLTDYYKHWRWQHEKKEWLFLGIIGIISLTACRAKTEVDNGREQETGRYSIATSGIEVEVPKEKEIVDDFTQFQEVLAKQTYVFETDMQNQYDSSSSFDDCVEMENSFVFLKRHEKKNVVWVYRK